MIVTNLVPNMSDSPAVRDAKRRARTVYYATKAANRARNGRRYSA